MNEWPGLWVLVGCFAGGVMLAELLRPRLPSGALAASEPRTIAAYVPAFTRTDPVWMAAGFAVLALWSLLAAPAATTGSILVNAGGATVAFVVARSLQRWILSRPQRAANAELLRVDDAIRATGATGLSALAYGAPLYLLSIALWDTVNEGVVAGTMRTLFSVAGVALGLTATTISVGFLSLASTWPVPRLRIALGSPRTGGAAT